MQEYLVRPRINVLLAQAIANPLTVVCGGMGCGKTRAVHDFTKECAFPVMWLQFADPDHSGSHFWSMFVRAVARTNELFANELKKLGLPDTRDKLNMYLELRRRMHPNIRRLYVIDDFSLVKDAVVLHFLEQAIVTTREDLPLTSTILISRECPSINISSLMIRNTISLINEEDLSFTESELHQFLQQQGLDAETTSLAKINQDTKGWPFIINFVARILKQTPGYAGYARGAIKQDISQLIEAEAWEPLSERLKRLLLSLSLTPHRSMDLVNILAKGDAGLIAELKQQNAFVHYDRNTDSYRIHQLFLDYLQTKQNTLPAEAIQDAYTTIAEWCVKNDFIVDALLNYEKIGDYQSISTILFTSTIELLQKNASLIENIFNRAPAEVFDQVDFSAALHVHAVMCTGKMQQALALLRHYEAKYLRFPEESAFKYRMLGYLYYLWGLLRMVMCATDDCYDFDIYFAKQYACLENFPIHPKCWYQHPARLWSSFVSSARAGAPQEYINALTRSMQYRHEWTNGLGEGMDDLCRGELLFFQADIQEAELYLNRAIERARAYQQYEIISRALFFIMRIAVFQGDYTKLELALKNAERQLAHHEYSVRFLTYDIVIGWYYSILGQQEKMPAWLKEKFTSQAASATENFGNYIKTRYCYLARNYTDLLPYLEIKRQPGTVLYERVESLAMKACVHLKTDNKPAALSAVQEAHETAQPNNIVMPFFELGKDMRALIALAEKSPNCALPRPWLRTIRHGTARYFRNQTQIISRYNKIHGISGKITLSPRENVILEDLCGGLSRMEIAEKRTLSVNTVKLHINSIYTKLGARNRADIFRIVSDKNMM